MLDIIGFDADDTLWDNEFYYRRRKAGIYQTAGIRTNRSPALGLCWTRSRSPILMFMVTASKALAYP